MALAAQIRIGPEDDPGMLKTRRRLAEMGERAAAPAHSAVGQRRERMERREDPSKNRIGWTSHIRHMMAKHDTRSIAALNDL